MLANQVALSLFFLYFVLMSDQLSGVINCSLQKFLKGNILVRHIMIFLSIYLFTFIMNWYRIDNIRVIETFDDNNNNNSNDDYLEQNIKNNKKYLIESFFYTIVIYLIFIISTKNEGIYLAIFLLGAILLVFGTILTKSINPKIYNNINSKYYLTENDIRLYKNKYKNNKKTVEILSKYHNTMSIMGLVLLSVLLIGSYNYYLKQFNEYKKNWSWIKFWFGNNKCSSL